MTPAEWAEVFEAGWNDPHLVKHAPAGDVVAIALAAMEAKCREIAQRHADAVTFVTVDAYHPSYPVEPGLNQPIFGADSREVQPGESPLHPLQSTCRCGRQIMKERSYVPWQHCD